MTEKLIIDLPAAADLPVDVRNDQGALRDTLAAGLFRQGRLSPDQARRLMGVSRREFEDRLAALGFPAADETDLAHEAAAASRLAHRRDA
ncbi:UPF0175 family protein [Rhodocista pekingensis]|uniref:UPF0175 family protein n=1 Tax=Rhodocista pekingensis TaxID=201185 RepID=A0ABW2L0N2_9PROT